jgi:hypothetical protein
MSPERRQEFINGVAARIIEVVEKKGNWSIRPPNIEQRIQRNLSMSIENDLGILKENQQAVDLAQLLKELTNLPVERLCYDAMEALESDKPQNVLRRWFQGKEESHAVNDDGDSGKYNGSQAESKLL